MDSILSRRSIRKYQDKPVESVKLTQLLEAARQAPSAKNLQNWRYVVVRDQHTKNQLVSACRHQQFIAEAPVVIAGIADPTLKWYQLDMGITFEHIALQAVELGLGSCWIGAFDEPQVSKLLKVPRQLETVILMTVGYPAESPRSRPRNSLDTLVCYDSYTE